VTWWVHTARLASILAGVGLATTRLGLVAHELIGHGGTAIACGGSVIDARLFWFAGGWIRYDLPHPYTLSSRLAVSLGGIALELAVGVVLWVVLARRTSLAAKIVRATGAAIAIHAAWYLAVGTYHGFGDGWLVRQVLGDGRYAVAIAAGLVGLAFAYFGARAILGVLAAAIPGDRRARVAGVLVAAALAGGLQAALAAGEVRVRRDTTYGAIMQPESDRLVAKELENWDQEQRARGVQVDDAARRAREAALAAKHRELPFAYILGALTVLAILAGAWRARPGTASSIPTRLLVIVTAIAVWSVALVIAIDAAFA